MSRLKNIVGNILNEFTQAQHAANLYAARLGREYAENDLLRYFMIPNAYADALTFSLKFAVESANQTETVKEINYHKLMLFFSQLAISVSETTITTALYAADGFAAKDKESYRRFKEKEKTMRNDFREFLSKKLRVAFLKKGINEIDEDGFIACEKIFEIAMEVINEEFFSHPELDFSAKRNQEISEEIKESCSSYVETLIQHSCKEVNLLEEKESEIMDIVLDSASLSKVSPESIQQIDFKINLRNYQISPSETDGEVVDCIIPASM